MARTNSGMLLLPRGLRAGGGDVRKSSGALSKNGSEPRTEKGRTRKETLKKTV